MTKAPPYEPQTSRLLYSGSGTEPWMVSSEIHAGISALGVKSHFAATPVRTSTLARHDEIPDVSKSVGCSRISTVVWGVEPISVLLHMVDHRLDVGRFQNSPEQVVRIFVTAIKCGHGR